MSYDKINDKYKAFANQLGMNSIMKDMEEAFVYLRWKNAINEEIKIVNKNQT